MMMMTMMINDMLVMMMGRYVDNLHMLSTCPVCHTRATRVIAFLDGLLCLVDDDASSFLCCESDIF
jgi:hypothetical protein